MPQIGSRTFSDGVKKYISLSKEEIVRPIYGLAGNWNRLTIGLSVAMNPNGVSDIVGTLTAGICSGTTNPYSAALTTNFLGRTNTDFNWTYTDNSGNPYYAHSRFPPATKVGATLLTYNIGSQTMNIVSTAGAVQRRSLVCFHMRKVATDIYHDSYSTPVAQIGVDMTSVDLWDMANSIDMTPTRDVAQLGTTTVSATFSESTGLYDSFNLYWTGTPALEIYAVHIVRIT